MLEEFLRWLHSPRISQWDLVHREILEEHAAELVAIPSELDPSVKRLINAAGIEALYSHQARAICLALGGKSVVLSTTTASGKTLAYQAPVLDCLVRDPNATALFLFPLKALERDQTDSFRTLARDSGIDAAVYDGDTPESERRTIRAAPPRVLITNPDMLHLGLLPYHDSWRGFFSHLSYVVLDEVHAYKGIFGSHISQVIVRMLRVCELHGSRPQFFACSATIANPGTFVSKLIGNDVEVVDRSGAPTSERHFLFLNPKLSVYTVAARVFVKALESGLKTIVFARARKLTELITMWVMHDAPHLRGRISSYRAGFLPEERREIEAKLFSGQMDGVISTSALEMGIDVGGLDLCILVGYPGTIMTTWQRSGRVGRSGRPSAIALIAGDDALDQYFLRNPNDFFQRSCEEAVLDPTNSEVLKRHIPCAAAEAPILAGEGWTRHPEIQSVLEELQQSRALYESEAGALYSVDKYPHRNVDLRSIGEAFGIFLEDRKTLIGSSSGSRALRECHQGAVYLHRTRQYVVTKLDLERRNVTVQPARLNYYTRSLSDKETTILRAPIRSRDFPGFTVREARLKVTETILAYEKRRTSGQDLLGVVELDLPPIHFETIGIWIEIPDNVKHAVETANLNFMGGIHAAEHAAISMFPLFALCDRDDIGGISTPYHLQVGKAAIFIYDGYPGGVGLAHRAFDVIEDLLNKTRALVAQCPCVDGCPSCIHSPKCGSGNKPLDKKACGVILDLLLEPEKTIAAKQRRIMKRPVIFPHLAADRNRGQLGHQAAKSHPPEGGPLHPTADTIGATDESINRAVKTEEATMTTRQGERITEIRPLEPELRNRTLPRSAPTVRILTDRPKGVVVFDLETQKLAHEVGGWKNISLMGLALGVAHTEQDGYLTFTEDNVSDLIALLRQASLIVGFNHVRFDYEVLRPYTNENLRALPNLDIFEHVEAALGHRLSLGQLAQYTLGATKSGSGLDAARWFREGRMDLLEQYCRDDVRITRDLYLYGVEKKFLLYKRRTSRIGKIPVDWPSPRRQ